MTKNEEPRSVAALIDFARTCLRADRYPRDHHPHKVFACPNCGAQPLRLRIEHHTGSSQRDFKGVIFGRCSACGTEERIFSFTGGHRKRLREERPVCECGSPQFLVAVVERIEGDEGLPGFFDEGVIVGECARCGRHTTFVYTD
ncbi:MAG: hypothetical protein PVJ55_05410 [Anaerolineae bacterium]